MSESAIPRDLHRAATVLLKVSNETVVDALMNSAFAPMAGSRQVHGAQLATAIRALFVAYTLDNPKIGTRQAAKDVEQALVVTLAEMFHETPPSRLPRVWAALLEQAQRYISMSKALGGGPW